MGASLLSPTHVIFLVIAVLLLFGAKRLPEVGRSLGTGLREFKTSVSGTEGATEIGDGVNGIDTGASPEVAKTPAL
jgi:sec-independent protein translocase protein TatA